MNSKISLLLASASVLVTGMAVPAFAETAKTSSATAAAGASDQAVQNDSEGAADIIVQARREEERLQDVPQTVNVVTGDTLNRLNTFSFDDISKLVSGVNLSRTTNSATIRGVAFQPATQSSPNVTFYLNEGPVQSTFLFQSMFDVGQVEVLKGPQGTLRGQSAPSGAITYYTRKPDLNEFGGSFSGTASDLDLVRLTGAINLPIAEGKFAVRVAGLVEQNDGNSPKSVNSTVEPYTKNKALRISARAEPVDNLSANFVYQLLDTRSALFSPVFGPGAAGGNAAFNANYTGRYIQTPNSNGPFIPLGNFQAVSELPSLTHAIQNFGSAQVDFKFAGQKLSYVGSYSNNKGTGAISLTDTGNIINGDIAGRNFESRLERWTHEIRLSSDERILGFLDYTVGAFHLKETAHSYHADGTTQNNGLNLLAGAFGTPLGAPLAITPNYRYVSFTRFDRPTSAKETSFFGTLTAHIDDRTEISGGVRFIHSEKADARVNYTTAAFRAVAYVNAAGQAVNPQTTTGAPTAGRIAVTAASCSALGGQFGTTYAGVCDVPVLGTSTPVAANTLANYNLHPEVFSASAKHAFSDNFMVYANFGTSWRAPAPQGGLNNNLNDPYVASLNSLPAETSKSYELGFKAGLFDRLTLNVAVYRQDYKNLAIFSPTGLSRQRSAPIGTPGTESLVPFVPVVPVDAKVDGVDVDAGFTATPNWTVNASFSYANGRYKNQMLPCFDPNFDGVADAPTAAALGAFLANSANLTAFQNQGIIVQRCKTSGATATDLPKWNLSARSEWHNEVVPGVEAFVNGSMIYYPKNALNTAFTVKPYALVDLSFGARSPDGGWEIQAFVKNLFNNRTITASGTDVMQGALIPSGFTGLFTPAGSTAPSGYSSVSYVPRRELGITLRYAFGSR